MQCDAVTSVCSAADHALITYIDLLKIIIRQKKNDQMNDFVITICEPMPCGAGLARNNNHRLLLMLWFLEFVENTETNSKKKKQTYAIADSMTCVNRSGQRRFGAVTIALLVVVVAAVVVVDAVVVVVDALKLIC